MKLLAIDGNSIINRAFYGVRLLSTKDGRFTNAVYGFISILEKLREAEQPDGIAVAFDVKKPTFRHEKYAEYKAGRHATPPELLEQFAPVKEWLTLMGYKVIECPGFEADDILGTIAEMCEKGGIDCAIATGDRVLAKLDELKKNLPEGMELLVTVDTNDFVRASINEVMHTLVEAMILVFLVVFLFLQNWRATLIPCVAVPVSIVGTFAGMLALGYTINTLTLFGLVLAIGRLPLSVLFGLITVIPLVIAGFWLPFLFWYFIIGYALASFVNCSYTNAAFDRFFNTRIEGAEVGRGMQKPSAGDDDEWEDLDPDDEDDE